MARDEAYRKAEEKIHRAWRTGATGLFLNTMNLTEVPESLGQLTWLQRLYLQHNLLTSLPESLRLLTQLERLVLVGNPLNPELAAAYEQGLDALRAYLRAEAEGQIVLNEAKLILVGEGGVGKSSLLAALFGEQWVSKRDTTHGVEIKTVALPHPLGVPPSGGKGPTKAGTPTEIKLNGWDFGGQPLYRPTHQLFFTAPAVYLAVWEPRRGPVVSCVDEWVKMIKLRAYDPTRPDERPRILVVATHGGPKERRDHIDEEALRKEFGELIESFHHVDSFDGYGLDELKAAMAGTAAAIPQVGRSVPISWKRVLDAVRRRSEDDPYISYEQFEHVCNRQSVSNDLAAVYAAILNELGYLIHYRTDPALKDIVILKADWLSKAISFVLEDQQVKDQNGLVQHDRLHELWNDPARPEAERYPDVLHPIFLKLMERFDLSYEVAMPADGRATSLVAQLVPGARPDGLDQDWPAEPNAGDTERVQVCRIVDAETGQPARAEGLLYRLIVRLHRYSLGRDDYSLSRHWQRGMVLDDRFNGRAFIEQIGDDIRITVRAAYPERLLHHLCEDVKWLCDHFWKGLDCLISVPCVPPCKATLPVEALITARQKDRPEYPCPVCGEWHKIDSLLSKPAKMPELRVALGELRQGQAEILRGQREGFQSVRTDLRRLISQADERFAALIQTLTDEAKEGPRLFSFEPVEPGFFDRPKWISEKFRLTLWCEHSRVPLPALNGEDDPRGIYELQLTREWVTKAAPFLKLLSGTLSLVLPVAASATKLLMADDAYKRIENELDFGQKCGESFLAGGEKAGEWLGRGDAPDWERGEAIRAEGGMLRQLQVLLKEKDPSFGGLIRVQNKRREFLWVHEQFVDEY